MALYEKIAIVLVVAVLMEGYAWAMHKYVMHGIGWGWHRDHHEPHDKTFEVNDRYAIVFGAFTTLLFWIGHKYWTPLWYVAAGITLYGLMYAFVHDGLVHQRWPWRWVPKRGYLRRLVQAHRLHHAVTTRGGAVSFGFCLAPDPKKLHAELRAFRAEAARERRAQAPA
ncbi:MAG: sterol desaturase family protein [Pseudomonadota bacterium]